MYRGLRSHGARAAARGRHGAGPDGRGAQRPRSRRGAPLRRLSALRHRRLMRWADAHRTAMGFAFEAHEDLNLDTFGRIDVFDAIVTDSVRLHFRPLDCAALYLPASVAGRAGVLVNELHPLALQRYSAA